ncbi:hypothetical protein EGI31_24920 [Lacihabitans soyangensis]|uniref:Uncharacterized protein n=1 Tax=Lacihabitans soyangensis TaxID=869394 RepID=A0AAE3KVL3_9BACT|nr:hypothetical protein [Lacihabitans soyangensis]MCP9766194.1 hypothetical protein [Lacihabitans soyangensis]
MNGIGLSFGQPYFFKPKWKGVEQLINKLRIKNQKTPRNILDKNILNRLKITPYILNYPKN